MIQLEGLQWKTYVLFYTKTRRLQIPLDTPEIACVQALTMKQTTEELPRC